MAIFINLITVLIFATYHFSFIFCQFRLEPEFNYRPRKSGSGRLHMQRKASDLSDLYTSAFLKEIEARMGGHSAKQGPESKVPHQWQAAIDTHPKKRTAQRQRIVDENIKRENTGRIGRKKKESEQEEDNDPTSRQIDGVKKRYLRKSRHSEKSGGKHHEEKKVGRQQNCNEKCFTPKCVVECTGEQSSAACSAAGCKALTRGQDSASLCSGDSCHALCFKEDCISGCEGVICIVKCHGKKCHAVSEGPKSGSSCEKDGCMAYGNGNGTQITCEGKSCQAQCMGEKCTAACNGTNCVAGCTGHGCTATCQGQNCQRLEQVGDITVDLSIGSSKETNNTKKDYFDGDGYYGNKNFIDKKNAAKEIANKDKTKTPEGAGKQKNKDSNEDSDGKVRLEYEVDIRLTPSLVLYIRDKIYQLKKMAGYMQYLKMGQ